MKHTVENVAARSLPPIAAARTVGARMKQLVDDLAGAGLAVPPLAVDDSHSVFVLDGVAHGVGRFMASAARGV